MNKFCKTCQTETERSKTGSCKPCNRTAVEKYRAANLEKISTANANRYAKDPDKYKARSSKWRYENPERVVEALQKWFSENPNWRSKWCSENKEKVIAAKLKYNLENPEKVLASYAKYRVENKSKHRVHQQNRRARSSGGKLSRGLAEKLFSLQRGRCACGCKKPLGNDYHLDHIMPLALGGPNTDNNIQLLSAICNRKKSAKHPIEFMQKRGFLL